MVAKIYKLAEKFFIVVILFNLFITFQSEAEAKIKIENGMYILNSVEGSAAINNRKKSVVREDAKRSAYGNIIEKILNDLSLNDNENENYKEIYKKIYSKMPALVKDFKIISEKVTDDGNLNINVACKISEKNLDNLIGSDVINMLGNPRVMILIDERIAGITQGGGGQVSLTESEILKLFEEAGYLIVDPQQARTLLNLNSSQNFDDPSKLTELAKTLRADIIITGKASAGAYAKQKIHGITLYGISGTVQLKAVLTQTAYQISSKTFAASTGKKPAGSISEGAGRCFKEAAHKATEQIIYKIAYNMASAGSAFSGKNINIKIFNASFGDVEKIENALKEFAGNSGKLFERSYKNNILEIDLISKHSARDTASFLSEHGININALTVQTIEANILKDNATKNNIADAPNTNLKIMNVSSFAQAGEIEDKLKNFLQASINKFSSKYNDQTLEIFINFSDGIDITKTERDIAVFFENNGIKINSLSSGFINGNFSPVNENQKSEGLLNWSW